MISLSLRKSHIITPINRSVIMWNGGFPQTPLGDENRPFCFLPARGQPPASPMNGAGGCPPAGVSHDASRWAGMGWRRRRLGSEKPPHSTDGQSPSVLFSAASAPFFSAPSLFFLITPGAGVSPDYFRPSRSGLSSSSSMRSVLSFLRSSVMKRTLSPLKTSAGFM